MRHSIALFAPHRSHRSYWRYHIQRLHPLRPRRRQAAERQKGCPLKAGRPRRRKAEAKEKKISWASPGRKFVSHRVAKHS